MSEHKHELAKRTRVVPTRAGIETVTFYVCYYCPIELTQEEYELEGD